jgi:hypothetical protein
MKKTILVTLVFLGSVAASQAEGHHPRRKEVNHRLENQNKRIDRKVADGQMSKKEGAKLHKDDHQIRQEERDMASQDHGHITKQEQKTLNQQENGVSKKIATH